MARLDFTAVGLERVRITGEAAAAEELALHRAIPSRRTPRKPFGARPLPAGLVEAMRSATEQEAAWLVAVDGEQQADVADLVDEGDRSTGSDPHFREELARWLRPARRGDRLSDRYMFGLGPILVRRFDLGRSTGRKDRELALAAPLLAVIGTDGDGPRDWLAAGQAIARALLRAAADGVEASWCNQPVQVAGLRLRLAETIGAAGFPQVVLRLGYGPAVRPAARRPVAAVLEGC